MQMVFSIFDKDGNTVNTIVASEEFVTAYCEKHGYAYKQEPEPVPEPDPVPEPTTEEILNAMLGVTENE